MRRVSFFIKDTDEQAQIASALIKSDYEIETHLGHLGGVSVLVCDDDVRDIGPGMFEEERIKPTECEIRCGMRNGRYLWAVPTDGDPETIASRANMVTKYIRDMIEHGTPPTEEDLKRLLQVWGFGLGTWDAVYDTKRLEWDLSMRR